MDNKLIADNIKYYRSYQELTQKELADRAKVHYITISRYESGKMQPSLDHLKQISAALNVKLTNLVTDRRIKPKKIKRNMIDGDRLYQYMGKLAASITNSELSSDTEANKHDRTIRVKTICECMEVVQIFIKGRA